MPPVANTLDSCSGSALRQFIPEPDLDHTTTENPILKNFFNSNESKEVLTEELQVQMVDLLHSTQKIHEIGASRNMTVLSVWNPDPNGEGSCYESSHAELGSLVSRQGSPDEDHCSKGFPRKRSLSSILETEISELETEISDQRGFVHSNGGSDSDVGVEEETDASVEVVRSPLKLQRIERTNGVKVSKDLLTLSLSTVSRSECSSYTGESEGEINDTRSDACNPFRHCKVHPSSCNDAAESDVLNDTPMPSVLLHIRSNHAHEQGISSLGDDEAVGNTSTNSSTDHTSLVGRGEGEERQEIRLTLQFDSLDPNPKKHDAKKTSAQPSLTGFDESVFNPLNHLVMLGSDAGFESHGLQLVHMLLRCADATAKQHVELAATILGELYQGASLYGDSMQRVAAYFAEGLAARIVGKDSPSYSSLMKQPSKEDLFSAFTTLYRVTPYFQFAHFTANQAILEAVEGHEMVHVIDLDIMQGFQWPSLIQALAARPGGPPHLRITGIGAHCDILKDTARWLSNFAECSGVPFDFQSVVKKHLEDVTIDSIVTRVGETIVINSVLQMHRLLNSASGEKLHTFLNSFCRQLNPCLVTLVEQEANHNATPFLGRFMEALHYYAAVFDSLDASLPQQNEERVKIEQIFFAQQIKNIVACEEEERVERHETSELWQQRLEIVGFSQVPLSSHSISQAKLLLNYCPCEGYRLHERTGSVSLGWQDRQLLSASAWAC